MRKPRHSLVVSLLFALPLLAAAAGPAKADDHDRYHDHDRYEHERHDERHYGFHGRDFHSFSAVELRAWRGGHWHHAWHNGRFGWWFAVGGIWYWYPEPVYPYPTIVGPAVFAEEPPPPPPVVVEQAPPPPPPAVVVQAPSAPPGQPAPQFWYFCAESKTYYPYVSSCVGPWQQVPAAPR